MNNGKTRPAITLTPFGKSVRVEFAGETVAESAGALVLREGSLPPVLYIPKADVNWALAAPTERRTHCPYKGDACYWSVSVNGRAAENAIWAYPDAIEAVAAIRGCVAFYWDKMDAWYLGGQKADRPAF